MASVADIVASRTNTAEAAGAASAQLRRFAVTYYTQPGIMAAMVALQDREGFDVSLILFALWHGISGRGRLDRRDLAAADRAVRVVRNEVVRPLRRLRRRLRSRPDLDIQHLREAVKALELEAEKTALHRLAAIAAPEAEGELPARLAAASANLALYLRPIAALSAEAALIRNQLAVLVAER